MLTSDVEGDRKKPSAVNTVCFQAYTLGCDYEKLPSGYLCSYNVPSYLNLEVAHPGVSSCLNLRLWTTEALQSDESRLYNFLNDHFIPLSELWSSTRTNAF